MVRSPILLVADDLALIADVRRALVLGGYECILASNAADAVIAWGHHLPNLVLIQPSVESQRANVVIDELMKLPDAGLVRILLLGEAIYDLPYEVEPCPLDADHFLGTVRKTMRPEGARKPWDSPPPGDLHEAGGGVDGGAWESAVQDASDVTPAIASDVLALIDEPLLDALEHEPNASTPRSRDTPFSSEDSPKAPFGVDTLLAVDSPHALLALQRADHAIVRARERARIRLLDEANDEQQREFAIAALKHRAEQGEQLAVEQHEALRRAQKRVDEIERQGSEEVAQLKSELETQRMIAERAELEVNQLKAQIDDLETRQSISLHLPARAGPRIPRQGIVELESLIHLVSQLVEAQNSCSIELGVEGGSRSLYFQRGAIVAAESSFHIETLIARARRDGLLDTRQENELRMLRSATPREQLEAMRSRGFIRDIETVPLVQRFTEQIALEALSERTSHYRICDDVPGPQTVAATLARPVLPLLVEAIRRGADPDSILERIGGAGATPVLVDSSLELKALGLSDRERKMLSWIDGEVTVEDLSLASGLRVEDAFRTILVAKVLGIVEIQPAQSASTQIDPEIDLSRLESKFDEIQEADYFRILGLPRSASTDDVARAYHRLSAEFDPIRYSGHADPSLQQRAAVVAKLLDEAAKALQDDRTRREYARHLLD